MADWFIATEGVKVVKESASLWPQIITAVSSIGAAFGGVWYGQWRVTRREKEAAAEKKASEALFISTELVFMLEQFAEECASVAKDYGDEIQDGAWQSRISVPGLDYSTITGDWRALPQTLMYKIRELPVLLNESVRIIYSRSSGEYSNGEFIAERQYQYTRLGIIALIQVIRLRKLVGFPETRLNATSWSAQQVLWKEWWHERKRRAMLAILHVRALAEAEIKNGMRNKARYTSGSGEKL